MRPADEQFLQGLQGEVPPPADTATSSPEPEKAAEEAPLRSVTERNLFMNAETSPVVLDFALLKQFQLEWLGWLPDTLWSEIEYVFKTSVADVNKIKIQATQTLHTIDAFWEQWEVFEKTIHALTGVIPMLGVLQPPTLGNLLVGVDIANAVREETYSDQVSRYCAAVFLHENTHYAPDPLEFCQPYLSQPQYTCQDCGKKGSALPPWDGLCSSCAGHYRTEHPLALKPDPELVAKGRGTHVTVTPLYDPKPVQARFQELKRLEGEALETAIHEVDVDIEAARLLAATDFRDLRRQQLKEQLTSLKHWLGAAA